MNLLFGTTYIATHKFAYIMSPFHLILNAFSYLISVLIHFSFNSEWFNFHDSVSFLLFLLSKSSFNVWWSVRIQSAISIFLYLLWLAWWSSMWPTLEKASWDAKKKVYFFWLDEIFCKYLLDPFSLWCPLAPEIF